MKKIILFFCFLSFVWQFSQTTITISIKESKGKTLDNINVQLQKNGTTLDFKKTNQNGLCVFNVKEPGIYQIKLTSMLYKTQTIDLDAKENTSLEVVLEPQITEIKEVEIKSRPKIAFQRQDTIKYNLKEIKDGTERSAEDLIKKLPGLDVNDNGKVTYKGNQIGQVLIDGQEFFGKNHKMATQNITADMLEGVDLWQNYTTINGNRSTALNLKLKDEYKNHITGNLDANYGTKNSYLGHANLFRFSKAGNLAFIADANNIAKDPINYMDFNEMNTQENIDNKEGVTKLEIPSFLNNDGKVKSKDNQFGALQYSKSSKTNSLSIFSIFNNAQLTKLIETKNIAFQNQPQNFNFLQNQTENNTGFFGTTQLKFKKIFKDQSYLYYNFGYNPTIDNYKQEIDRMSNVNSFNSIQNKVNHQSWVNYLSYNKTVKNSQFIFSFNQNLDYQKTNLKINSNQNLFLTNQNSINQFLDEVNNQNALDFYWKNTNKIINFNFHTGFNNQFRKINLSQLTNNSTENLKYQYQFFTNDLFLRKQLKNFEINTALTSKFITVNQIQNHYLEPFFNLKYSIPSKVKMDVSIEYSQKYEIPNTIDLLTSNVYNKNLSFKKNIELSPLLLSKASNYRFNWHYFNLEKGNFTFFMASYTRSHPIFTKNTINYGNFSEIQNVLGNQNQQWFLLLSDLRNLNKFLILKSQINLNQNLNNNFINNKSNNLKIQFIEFGQRLTTKFKKFPIQMDLGYKYSISEYKQTLFSTKTNSKNIKLNLGARTNIKEEWKINILGEYFIQKVNNTQLDNFLLGGQISYQKKESKVEYNLMFNNLLNLNSFKYINSSITSIGTEDSTLYALHGYIMGGLKFYF